jgi:hypothetical protein
MQRTNLITLLVLLFPFGVSAQVFGDVITSWDFANGIPDEWENDSESGIGLWEYRGIDTSPDLTVGSQGSCGGNSVPIDSESNSNGWVIFDSNYWDDPNGPCGNIGSGDDPGPHTAWLITESIDLTDFSTIILTFRQQYRYEQANSSVYVSTDDGETWELAFENPGNFSSSEDGEWASASLSDLAGGEDNVRLKFEFDGFYYWWMLDDIYLYVPNDNDLTITNERYTLYDGTLPPVGFGDMEYNAWPTIWTPELNFSARINNIGGLAQTGVYMNVRVTNSANEFVYSEDTDPDVLTAGQSVDLSSTPSFTPAATPDEYTIRWLAQQVETDESPANNERFKDFEITEFTFAHDEGVVEDIYVPQGAFADVQVEIGNLFEPVQNGDRFHSIGVALGEGTDVGSEIYGIVYDANLDSIIGQTGSYTVNEWDINGIGGDRIVHLLLEEDIITETDTLYAVLVGAVDETSNLRIARSGESFNQSAIINAPTANNLAYLLRSPMVRMHVFASDATPGCLDPEALNFSPEADTNDGSCRFAGCTNPNADNFDPDANFEDGSCLFTGCTDPEADNFDPNATDDDGSCIYLGCTDVNANNYDETANADDGSCVYNDAFLSANVSSGCAPLEVTFTNQTDVVENGSCVIDIAGFEVIEDCVDQFSYTFDTPGSYSITYTYTVDDFVSEFTLGPVEVFAVPVAPEFTFDEGSNTLTCTGCEDAFEVIWYLNGEVFDLGSSEVNIINNGNYAVEILSAEGCSAVSEEEFIVITNIEETELLSEVWVYPNPTSGLLSIRTSAHITDVAVYDMMGRAVWQQSNINGIEQLDLSHLASGQYVLQLQSEEKFTTQKVRIR